MDAQLWHFITLPLRPPRFTFAAEALSIGALAMAFSFGGQVGRNFFSTVEEAVTAFSSMFAKAFSFSFTVLVESPKTSAKLPHRLAGVSAPSLLGMAVLHVDVLGYLGVIHARIARVFKVLVPTVG